MEIKETLNRLARSRSDQVIAGVCAGIAETTETPVWMWRAIFVFLGMCAAGVLIYFILWWFMPLRD